MNPVTGPYYRSYTIRGSPNYWGYAPDVVIYQSTYYRQRSPYTLPLPFQAEKYMSTVASSRGTYPVTASATMAGGFSDVCAAPVINKAHAQFVDRMSDQSTWMVNIIERGKTLDMVVSRATQLAKFTRELRKGNLRRAAKVLNVPIPRHIPIVNSAKRFGNAWLEFHFGWTPLVEDIYSGVKTLCSDYPTKKIVARASGFDSWTYLVQRETQRMFQVGSTKTGVLMQGYVRITNPNLSLINDLGLINPASVAWELVPFSFVVDWFANVGQVLSSFSDFAGKEVLHPFTTTFQQRNRTHSSSGVVPGNWGPPYDGPWSTEVGSQSILVRRDLGITGPTIVVKPFKGLSVTRGATAVALLNQALEWRKH